MSEAKADTCGRCRHAHRVEHSGGVAIVGNEMLQCRRFPPHIAPVVVPDRMGGASLQVHPVFPPVNALEGCGEFAPRVAS
jgi:hypothetical protein